MNKIYKTKKIAFICAILLLTIALGSMLYSCDKAPDIYTLIENILQNKNLNPDVPNGLYSFDADLNIKINKNYLYKENILFDSGKSLDNVPDELTFKIDGFVKNSEDNISQIAVNFRIAQPAGEEWDFDLKTIIYKKANMLYFELNDVSKIVLDILLSTGFIDAPVKDLFDNLVEYDNGTILCFDLTGFDLKTFDKYTSQLNKAFTLKSHVNYYFYNKVNDFDIADYDSEKVLYFSDIKNKIDKDLLKIPYYRYSELNIVIEMDKNNDSFLNILAIRENGEANILEKLKLDCDLSKLRDNGESLFTENILPMRYVLELLGETVGWDDIMEQAYITRGTQKLYFDGVVINSKTYISLLQIIGRTNYNINSAVADEYIEITITRK